MSTDTDVPRSIVSGYETYELHQSTGKFEIYGVRKTYSPPFAQEKSLFEVFNDGDLLIQKSMVTFKNTISERFMESEFQRTSKDSTITAQHNAYPVNGVVGKYWYIRQGLADTATITSPIANTLVDENYLIEWSKTDASVNVDIELSLDGGSTWSSIANGQSGTSLNYNFKNLAETTQARLRIRASFGSSKSAWDIMTSNFTIKHNFPPNIPTNLKPAGVIVDRGLVQRLSWQHNHPAPPSKYKVEWSTNQTTWNIIEKNSIDSYVDVGVDVFPASKIYWRVTTYNDRGLASPVSNVAVFTAAVPSDAPIITSANTTIFARPIITWSQGDQASYQVQILNSIGATVWDSGEVVSADRQVTTGLDLANGSTYTIRVRTKTALGLWTAYAEQSLEVSFTEPPTPTLELIPSDGVVGVVITNPEPTSNQPEVLYNNIYRNGIRIATRVGSNYQDYTNRSNKEYQYRVVAIGENGTVSNSEYKEISIILKHSFLNDLYGNYVELRYDPKRSESKGNTGSLMQFKGRQYPVMQFDKAKENNISLSFSILKHENKVKLEEIIDSATTLLYRDNRERKMFVTVSDLNINDDVINTDWYDVSFTINRVDHSEVV